jgi:hypothetical protein
MRAIASVPKTAPETVPEAILIDMDVPERVSGGLTLTAPSVTAVIAPLLVPLSSSAGRK